MITINTSGKSAKDAAAITEAALNKALNKDQEFQFQEVQVFVDDTMSAFEIKKILENYGLDVLIQDDDGRMTLFGSVKDAKNYKNQNAEKAENNFKNNDYKLKKLEDEKNYELEKFKNFKENEFKEDFKEYDEEDKNLEDKNKNNETENIKVEKNTVFLIMNKSLGRGDIKLGEILIKGFLAGLVKSDPTPDAVILLNEGVKLALFDSSTCDHLKDLEARGTQILISGVCASHFGITENIGTGIIANIYEIADVINSADKVVSL